MPDVSAVSVSPTFAVPLIDGAPVAFAFGGGPAMVSETAEDSFLPSAVQMAPRAAQSVVTGRTTVTSLGELGSTVISHRTLAKRSRDRAPVTSPPVTVKAWSRSVLALKPFSGASLKRNSKVNAVVPSCEAGVS